MTSIIDNPPREEAADIACAIEQRIRELLTRMTVEEKIGQMAQRNAAGGHIPNDMRCAVSTGAVGSFLNDDGLIRQILC